jgi:hypothetical protein
MEIAIFRAFAEESAAMVCEQDGPFQHTITQICVYCVGAFLGSRSGVFAAYQANTAAAAPC